MKHKVRVVRYTGQSPEEVAKALDYEKYKHFYKAPKILSEPPMFYGWGPRSSVRINIGDWVVRNGMGTAFRVPDDEFCKKYTWIRYGQSVTKERT